MKIIFRILGWIVRLIIIVAILLAGYLAYQKFFNDVEPKVAIDSLLNTSSSGIQNVSHSIQKTAQRAGGDSSICYEKDCYTIEIADTPARRQQGLMHRETLADDAGMLFVFDTPSNYNFWMKNTKLILDMVWLDESFEILYINNNTPPCTADPCPTYGPSNGTPATYVLEVNGGEAENWELGEKLTTKNL